MTLSEIIKDDIKKQLRGVYSTGEKSKQVKVHELPDLKYIVTIKHGKYDFRKLPDFKNLYKCLNRVKHYTAKKLKKNFIIGPTEIECEDRLGDDASIAIMICIPDYLDNQLLHLAMMDSIGQIDQSIHLKSISGGLFAQILHEGTYEDIIHTKAKLNDVIMANGYMSKGNCTEINMAPMFHNNQCKIIIRQRIETI